MACDSFRNAPVSSIRSRSMQKSVRIPRNTSARGSSCADRSSRLRAQTIFSAASTEERRDWSGRKAILRQISDQEFWRAGSCAAPRASVEDLGSGPGCAFFWPNILISYARHLRLPHRVFLRELAASSFNHSGLGLKRVFLGNFWHFRDGPCCHLRGLPERPPEPGGTSLLGAWLGSAWLGEKLLGSFVEGLRRGRSSERPRVMARMQESSLCRTDQRAARNPLFCKHLPLLL